MPETRLKRTPLYECHLEAKARLVPFAGYEMPVQYAGVLEEHRAVRTAVGLFDVSHMGEIEVTGRRALDFVQYVTCNDASKLTVGRAQYAGLMTPRGTFVDDLLVHKMADDRYFLVVNAANKDKDHAYLCAQCAGFDAVDVRDRSDEYAQIAVQGPKALPTLQALTAVELGEIKYYRFVEGTVDGAPAIIARTGYTGEDGFEVYVAPEHAPRLWRALLAAGREFGIVPAGLGARDTLRFEACMPLYGNDIDDTTTPYEAGLGWIVKLDKGGFLGREALLRQRGDGVRRTLVGFEMTGRGIARHGYPIWAGGQEVGAVTSGTHAPTLGKALGMGYVPVALSAVGSEFEVEIREQKVAARVVEMPFYRRAR
ncbi:MAG: glycine cleavage system protein T [Acidobacteria bacterium 21-70-11]|nr:MAG: glycine cleavage system protein T [Acidobacteria bacterium 21-70-11]HQU33296.1 glycine cleavage system aminomethyltransferase GcvT [Thermoanaerobaculaceae bacterium]